MRHHLQDAPVELLLAFVSTPKLMKDHAILDEQDALTEASGIGIMGYHQDRSLFVTIQAGQLLHKTFCVLRIQRTRRYCFVSTINILWLSTQLSSICGQNKSKAAHCPSCFSFTPKLSTLFFDVFNQLRIAADEISIKCLVHRLSVHFHHMCDNLFCECCCTSDSVIAP